MNKITESEKLEVLLEEKNQLEKLKIETILLKGKIASIKNATIYHQQEHSL